MVGLALRTGRPIVFRREVEALDEMKSVTDFEQLLAQPIEDHVDSMLACPFFAADSGAGDEPRSNFVLFADTSDRSFFDDERLRLVYAACKGFVENIEEALVERRMHQISSAYIGHRVSGPLAREEAARHEKVGLSFDNVVFAEFRRDLTFSTLRSTELDDAPITIR